MKDNDFFWKIQIKHSGGTHREERAHDKLVTGNPKIQRYV
jgi:hypothetical protein